MKRFLRNNGLSLAMFGLFFFSLIGQYLTGFEEFNESQHEHGQSVVTYIEYFGEGHFIEAVFENWESEFLQMGMYIVLTISSIKKVHPNQKRLIRLKRLILFPKIQAREKMFRFRLIAAGFF